MIRALAIGLTLLLQSIAGFVPGGLVLCVHDDGHWFLESAATPCCRVCPRAEQGPEGARGGVPSFALDGDGGGDDRCQDYLFGAPDARTSAVKTGTTDTSRTGETIGPAPALAVASVLRTFPAAVEGAPETGPPGPPGSLVFLRTVVLRC